MPTTVTIQFMHTHLCYQQTARKLKKGRNFFILQKWTGGWESSTHQNKQKKSHKWLSLR